MNSPGVPPRSHVVVRMQTKAGIEVTMPMHTQVKVTQVVNEQPKQMNELHNSRKQRDDSEATTQSNSVRPA